MRTWILTGMFAAFLGTVALYAQEEYYKVEVTRIASNVYQTRSGALIKTRYCHANARRDEAILRIGGYQDVLIFGTFHGNEVCDVERIVTDL